MTEPARDRFDIDLSHLSWEARLAYHLVKPRKSKVLHFALLGVASLLVLWGLVVCVTITLAVVAAIAEVWF